MRVTVFHPGSDNEQERVEVVERRPSPYYYSDLFNHDDSGPSAFKSYRKPEESKTSTTSTTYYCKPPQASSKKPDEKSGAQGLESYHPFSAKENFEPKQGGLGFYDFASGKVRKKHRVVEVKRQSKKKSSSRKQEKPEEPEPPPVVKEFKEDEGIEVKKKESDASNGARRKEYVKSVSLDVPSPDKNSLRKKGCKKSASLDIPLGEDLEEDEVGESSNRFRPIVPVKETEEGIEGGDEEEEEVKREKRKSLKKVPQLYNYNYRDCLTGAPKKHFPKSNEFSPAEIIQHVINSGGDSKSLLAACLAEWDAHARLMRPLTARTLTQCACTTGAQKQCVSSDDEDDFHYSRDPFPTSFISRGEFIRRSQESLRRREFLKEPIPNGENLGDEFVKGKKVGDTENSEESTKVKKKTKKGLNADEIFKNWGIVVEDEGGFENWNQCYEDNSDSAEAYRIAKEIVEETKNWRVDENNKLVKSACRSTESLYDLEDMNRRGLLYETAFDCKVSRSDDDLDELDRVTNHPVLHSRLGRSKSAAPATLIESYSKPPRPGSSFARGRSIYTPKDRRKNVKPPEKEEIKAESITDHFQNLNLADNPTPPSTAPLPSKFCGHDDFTMNSIKSAPELPISSPAHLRLKDTRLPVKSLRARDSRPKSLIPSCVDSSGSVASSSTADKVPDETKNDEFQNGNKDRGNLARPKNLVQNEGLILEFKGRPEVKSEDKDKRHKNFQRPRSLLGPVLDFKTNPKRTGRLKFSSTESMATSSSGGSLESIKSSTSEGNRSTSSSESHRSSSLSSHSSDSVGNVVAITTANLQFHLQQTNPHHHNQPSKMHILSPISDKSSVEPASEMSDNNKNNNSQKPSPEDNNEQTNGAQHHPQKPELKLKRRALQNKNLINLGLQISSSSGETQGSDSGISIDSRTPRSSGLSVAQTETDFSDLPFDMPKLRRRRVVEQDDGMNRRLQESDACTSGSATSVDLRDLPFDMPKLRRRLRPPALSESQASSSQSVAEQSSGGVLFRPSMTLSLDLESGAIPSRGLSLDLGKSRGSGTMTLGAFSGVDLIDPSLPLEKQAWYHGAITRVEAENLLRTLKEGSYLVRNSESTRQDYSLSLKSAKGFMHMRIQKDSTTGQYILGQFSKPFSSIPDMIRHYSINRLPIRGAEHMCLLKPVAAQLL